MLSPKLKQYQKKFSYSYSFGAYPTLDLFKYQRSSVLKVLFHPEGRKSYGVEELLGLCEKFMIPYEFNEKAISKIAYKENTYIVGIFQKYESKLLLDKDHIALIHPRNMGNLGTIIRTMVSLGFNDLAIVKPAADIFDPKVVRSAMGTLFQLRFRYYENFYDYLNESDSAIGRSIYPFMLDGAISLDEVKFNSPLTLVFGNEGEGLEEEFQSFGQPVFIPQSKTVDSMNLSIAAAIGMWECRKGR